MFVENIYNILFSVYTEKSLVTLISFVVIYNAEVHLYLI